MNPPLFRRQRGFTLVELLVTLAVAITLLGIAVPAMTQTARTFKLSSVSNDFLAGLLMARSEAVKRNTRVVVCKSPDGARCSTFGGWQQGWIVFHDANNNGVRELAEEIMEKQPALPSTVRLTGNQNVANYISYTPTGITRLAGGGFQAGTLTICNQSTKRADGRQIVLSSSGRPRVQKVSLDECA